MTRSNPARSRSRGVTLLEGMIATVVIMIAVLGLFQGIVVAARQNAVANRLNWASSIAEQVKAGMAFKGRARLSGGLLAQPCVAGTVATYAGGAQNMTGACVIDIDAYDYGVVTSDAARIVPGYRNQTADLKLDPYRQFKRVLVWFPTAGTNQAQGVIVVSFTDAGQRQFMKKFVAMFTGANAGNESGLEI